MMNTLLLAAFTLVSAEKSATVVVPEKAEPSTLLCVEELTNYLAKITGKVLPVGSRVPRDRSGRAGRAPLPEGVVVIGTVKTLGDKVPKVAKEALSKAKQFEAAWTGTDGGNLWIVGKESVAELYATYHFLETKLGVRWFQAAIPEDPGDYVPKVKVEGQGLVIGDFQEFREPDFKYRFLMPSACWWNVIPKAGVACAVRNGYQPSSVSSDFMTGRFPGKEAVKEFQSFYGPRLSRRNYAIGGGHSTFTTPVPHQKFFVTHPEWFAVREGKRTAGWMYCLSNTNLLEYTVQDTIRRFKENDGYGIYVLGQADLAKGWCECPECRKLDGPTEKSYSSRVCYMASYMVPRIRAACPNATLVAWPYACYRTRPEKGSYDRDLECQYCDHGRCYGHALNDPKCIRNVQILAEMKAWLTDLPKMYTFEYFTDTPAYYACHERGEQEDLKFYKSLGLIGWFNECRFTGSRFVDQVLPRALEESPSNWQWLYATGHLLWNTDLDLDALLADAEEKYYGIAAKPMRAYHKLRRDLWNSRHECMGYPAGDQRTPMLLNAEGAKEKLLGFLAEAEKLVEVQSRSPRKDGGLHSSTSTSDFDLAVLKHRLSRDRKWLNDYWIKPNEKVKANLANTLNIPRATTPIRIDGDKSDAAWLGALYPNDRFRVMSEDPKLRTAVPDALKTSVGLVFDDQNLYFLVEAKEPHPEKMTLKVTEKDGPVWTDDGVEIMIFSPSVENCYYHIAVNANGVVYDARCPGNDKKYDLGVVAKGGRSDDGWFVEVKVPVKEIYDIVEGDRWRLQVVRTSTTRSPHGERISFGGALPHMTEEYPSFEFGSSCCANGAFDDIDKKTKKPTGWQVNNGEVRQEGANNVLFTKGFTGYFFRHGPLGLAPVERKLKYTFRAKGKGKVSVSFVRYDPEKRSGEWMPQPPGKGGTYELSDAWKIFSGTYTIKPHEWVMIGFSPDKDGCYLDDVNVMKAE